MNRLNLERLSRPEAFQGTISRKVRDAAFITIDSTNISILDVGCGTGLFLLECAAKYSANLKAFGADIDKEALLEGKYIFEDNGFNPSRFLCGDALKLPFPSEIFDSVYCLNTLINIHPFNKVETLMDELARVCKKGGKIIFDYRNIKNIILLIKYLRNTLTRQLTTHGHRLNNFKSSINRLNLKIDSVKPIGSKIPLLTMGYLLILEK